MLRKKYNENYLSQNTSWFMIIIKKNHSVYIHTNRQILYLKYIIRIKYCNK